MRRKTRKERADTRQSQLGTWARVAHPGAGCKPGCKKRPAGRDRLWRQSGGRNPQSAAAEAPADARRAVAASGGCAEDRRSGEKRRRAATAMQRDPSGIVVFHLFLLSPLRSLRCLMEPRVYVALTCVSRVGWEQEKRPLYSFPSVNLARPRSLKSARMARETAMRAPALQLAALLCVLCFHASTAAFPDGIVERKRTRGRVRR